MAMNDTLQLFGDTGVAASEFQDITLHSGLDSSNDKKVEARMQLITHHSQASDRTSGFDWRLRVYRHEWNEVSRGQIRGIHANAAKNNVNRDSGEIHLSERSKAFFENMSKEASKVIDEALLYDSW